VLLREEMSSGSSSAAAEGVTAEDQQPSIYIYSPASSCNARQLSHLNQFNAKPAAEFLLLLKEKQNELDEAKREILRLKQQLRVQSPQHSAEGQSQPPRSLLNESYYLDNQATGDQLAHLGSWYHNWNFPWTKPPIASDDAERCKTVESFNLTNSAGEVILDNLCSLAKRTFNCCFAGVLIMKANECYFKSHETSLEPFKGCVTVPRHTSLCSWTLKRAKTTVMPDLSLDPATNTNPIAVNFGIRFYAGSPLIAADGKHIGSFCILHTAPNFNFSQVQQKLLELFAATAMRHLESRKLNMTLEKMKSKFVANFNHEIRTPLHGIVGLCELLYNTELSNLQNEYVTDCANQAKVLLSQVNDVLDFRTLESGALEIQHRLFNPQRLFIDCCAEVQSSPQFNYSFTIQLFQSFHEDFQCFGDENRLRQILINLLYNAAKFSSANSKIALRIGYERQPPWFSSSANGASDSSIDQNHNINHTPVLIQPSLDGGLSSFFIHIEVIDNGIGIEEDMLGRIFQPFVQADDENSRIFGGKGLGLSITKRLVELMDGKVWVESQKGHGSNFHCYVKLYFEPNFKLAESKSIHAEPMPTVVAIDSTQRSAASNDAITFPGFLSEEKLLNDCDAGSIASHGSALYNNGGRSSNLLMMDQLSTSEPSKRKAAEEDSATKRLRTELNSSPAPMQYRSNFDSTNDGDNNRSVSKGNSNPKIGSSSDNNMSNNTSKSSGSLDNGIANNLKIAVEKRIAMKSCADVCSALPASIVSTASLRFSSSCNKCPASPPLPLRILIVDDNRINLKVLGRMLESEGYECVLAEEGRTALEEAKKGEFHLILMDLQLPEMDGFEITRRIRSMESAGKVIFPRCAADRRIKDNRGERTPIVALTASATHNDSELCFKAGMDSLLMKPFTKQHIRALIKQYIRAPKQQHSSSNNSDFINPNSRSK
jgi:signal transduction histidine kinase/CheY-like chemotaxis protein